MWFEITRQARGFDRREPVMHVVQQLDIRTVILAQALEERRHDVQILRSGPDRFRGQLALGRFIGVLEIRDSVRLLDAGYTALRAHRLVALRNVLAHLGTALVDVLAVRVAVDQGAVARAAAQQLVQRLIGHLAEDVPERDVDRGNRGHGHRTPAPVRATIEKLPRVFDPAGVAADEIRDQVIFQVGGNGELASVQRRITETETLPSE